MFDPTLERITLELLQIWFWCGLDRSFNILTSFYHCTSVRWVTT